VHRLAKQTIGSTRPLGWKLVQYMESDPKLNPEFGISHETVRKQEKEMMTYDRESPCSLAFLLPCSLAPLLPCSFALCSTVLAPGDLESAMKAVQSARGSGSGRKSRGRGGKAGGVSKGRDATPSYSSVIDGHRNNKGRGGKRGGYGKHVTFCYQCGGG